MNCRKFRDVLHKFCPKGNGLGLPTEKLGKQTKISTENEWFWRLFAPSTTPLLLGVTSQTTARICSPDSLECAKIGFMSQNSMYLVIWLMCMRSYLAKMSGFPCFFAPSTTRRLIGATSQTTAQNTSPDSVECAKIIEKSRNLTYVAPNRPKQARSCDVHKKTRKTTHFG